MEWLNETNLNPAPYPSTQHPYLPTDSPPCVPGFRSHHLVTGGLSFSFWLPPPTPVHRDGHVDVGPDRCPLGGWPGINPGRCGGEPVMTPLAPLLQRARHLLVLHFNFRWTRYVLLVSPRYGGTAAVLCRDVLAGAASAVATTVTVSTPRRGRNGAPRRVRLCVRARPRAGPRAYASRRPGERLLESYETPVQTPSTLTWLKSKRLLP